MLFSLVSLLALGATTLAHPMGVLEERTGNGCNADNVLRLLRATQRLDDSIAFCSQYLDLPAITESAAPGPTASVTITILRTTTTTETFVVTETGVEFEKLKKRCTDEHSTKTISTPDFIAKTTIDPSRLSSACGCLTIPLTTVTVPATDLPGTTSFSETQTETITQYVIKTESATITAPSHILASPTAVAGWDVDAPAPNSVDDAYYRVDLPFEIEVYGKKSSIIIVSVNGLIWFEEYDSGNYWYYSTDGDSNGAALPLDETLLPDVAVLPFWSDLYINGGQVQGIWYQIVGSTVSFEYVVSTWGSTENDYHFTVTFDSTNKVVIKYYTVADSTAGTAAVQNYSDNKAIVFSRNENKIEGNTIVIFDTNAGTVNSAPLS